MANFQVPETSGNFCTRGGRFGSHASNESFTPIYYGRLVFISYFNAGVRAVDIRDPYNPKEVAFYIPAITAKTDKRCVPLASGGEACKVAMQTNNVEVDDRGYIYIVDRANIRVTYPGVDRRGPGHRQFSLAARWRVDSPTSHRVL